MKYNLIRLSSFISSHMLFNFYFESVFCEMEQLTTEYPNFLKWYHKTVRDGILKKERDLLLVTVDYYIAGVAILKKTSTEKKICTLRVTNKFQRLGIGKFLFLKSFEYLDTEFPLITVSSTREYQFYKLFRYFNFKKESELVNWYLPYKTEITYNGILI